MNADQQNRENYFEFVVQNKLNIKLIIMGQDPYKIGANGIPFCKNKFEEYVGTCFLTILSSLGIEMDTVLNKSPIDFFKQLVKEEGIVFLNLSYRILSYSSQENSNDIREGFEINRIFLNKLHNTEKIIFIKLGKTKLRADLECLLNLLIKDFKLIKHPTLFHPAYTRIKKNKTEDLLEWVNTWKLNGLKKYLNKT